MSAAACNSVHGHAHPAQGSGRGEVKEDAQAPQCPSLAGTHASLPGSVVPLPLLTRKYAHCFWTLNQYQLATVFREQNGTKLKKLPATLRYSH